MYAPGLLFVVAGAILAVVAAAPWIFVPFTVVGGLLVFMAHSQVFAYRAGYWRGRAEVVRELTRTGALRPYVESYEPAPWDEWDPEPMP